MAGTWFINLALGFLGFFIVFFLSLSNNSIATTTVRGITAFMIFYGTGYIFRWMIFYITKSPEDSGSNPPRSNAQVSSEKIAGNEMEYLINNLSEEDTKKVVEYIRTVMKDK